LIQHEKNSENIFSKDDFISIHNLFFRTAKNNMPYFFGNKKSSLEDMKIAVILHKNKQYHWLLAEAFEAFEDFIEEAYAFAGFKDKNFWPLSDYGNISLSELDEKDFEWFVFQAKKKRDRPQSILNHFRNKLPRLQLIEMDNDFGVNLRLAIVLIEQLRHQIVHVGGTVQDKGEFVEEVLKKSGLYNNGKFDTQHKDFIESFFGSNDFQNTISLLEIQTNPKTGLNTYIDIFEVLGGYLMADALLIAECLGFKNNLGQTAIRQ